MIDLPAAASRTNTDHTRAVIWADGDEWERWMQDCIQYCDRRRYDVVALVLAQAGGRWDDAVQCLTDGYADVVVVADRDQVPVGPRIEPVVDDPYWTGRDPVVPPLPAHRVGRPEMVRRKAGC